VASPPKPWRRRKVGLYDAPTFKYHRRVTQLPFTNIGESHELAEDVRALFDELAASLSHEQRAYSGESHPVLDVYETDNAIEVIMDICGVTADAVRILFRNGVILIAGEKAPVASSPVQTFHLVEREFGRFARAVRVNGAFDVARASATLRDGELIVQLPKMTDRRGRAHRIPVTAPDRVA
jgi:HSP20 family protein